MEMKFDPMTGEPIVQTKQEPGAGGEELNFDPMTGEPIVRTEQGYAGGEEMSFDPMTGEPIVRTEQGYAGGEEMSFDPMTGEPIVRTEQGYAGGEELNFDPMTGQPMGATGFKKKSKKPIIFGIAAAVVVIGAALVVGITSGAFLSKGNKVLLAIKNTVEPSEFGKALDFSDIVTSGKYTIEVKGSAASNDLNVIYADKGTEKMIEGKASIVGGMDVDFVGGIDKEKVYVGLPFIDDELLLVYDYTKKNDGYFVDLLEDEGIDVKSLNQSIAMLSTEKNTDALLSEAGAIFLDSFRNLEFEKLEKKKFEVDNKKVSCKGYETVIENDDVEDFLDDVQDLLEENLETVAEVVELDELFDEIESGMKYMDELEVRFYIYKNKLACVQVEVGNNEAELQFLGGDTRMQNMCLEVDGRAVLEVEGSVKKNEEECTVSILNIDCVEWAYDTKSGEFSVDIGAQIAGSNCTVEGTITSARNEMSLEISDMKMSGETIPVEGTICIKKGVEIKMPKGDEFDIGDASESEILEIIEEYQQLLNAI